MAHISETIRDIMETTEFPLRVHAVAMSKSEGILQAEVDVPASQDADELAWAKEVPTPDYRRLADTQVILFEHFRTNPSATRQQVLDAPDNAISTLLDTVFPDLLEMRKP